MPDVTQPQSPEDLSKLKGPSWRWPLVMLMSTAATVVGFWHFDADDVPPLWAVLVLLISVIGFFVVFGLWIERNQAGHTAWWWKDGDALRVAVREYPTQAKGLVIEVQVKARPSFKLRWGSKGWCYLRIDGNDWVVNLKGERLCLVQNSQAALDSDGLTVAVVDFLFNAGRRWKIVPLDAGRVLRFVDQLGCGIEMSLNRFDGVDLEKILRSQNCADYHRRMQDKEAIVRLQQEHDRALDILCVVLPTLREAVKRAGRLPTKIEAMNKLCRVLGYLHDHLSTESGLRVQLDISEESWRAALRDLDGEEAKLAPPSGPGGVGTEV